MRETLWRQGLRSGPAGGAYSVPPEEEEEEEEFIFHIITNNTPSSWWGCPQIRLPKSAYVVN